MQKPNKINPLDGYLPSWDSRLYELEMAKARIVNLQLALERQAAIAESARKIIPANGKLPVPIIG